MKVWCPDSFLVLFSPWFFIICLSIFQRRFWLPLLCLLRAFLWRDAFHITRFWSNVFGPNSFWISNNGLVFFVGCALLFLILFTINFFDLKYKNPRIFKGTQLIFFIALLIISFSFTFSYQFNIRFFVFNVLWITPFLCFCGVFKMKTNYRPAKYFLLALFLWPSER